MKPLILYLYSQFSVLMPPTRLYRLKRWVLNLAGATVGDNARIVSSAKFFIAGSLKIGDNTFIGHQVLIVGGEANVVIGENCDIAPNVLLASGTHKIEVNSNRIAGKGYSLPIIIGDGSWICAGAIILGGTTIGKYSIVAAGAVAKGDFPPYSLIAGVPARVIRNLSP